MDTTYVSVIGLAFGDCGKGRFVDELCARLGAHTVARFNGGGQAAHNVMRADGRHHIFAHFGAGTLIPGTRTVLTAPVAVHPLGLLRENEYLERLGIFDAPERMTIDARCALTTPYLQAAGRLRELLRHEIHGSCGIGFGETVRMHRERPELSVTFGDLSTTRRELCRERLEAQRQVLLAELAGDGPAAKAEGAERERRILGNPALADEWLEKLKPLVARVKPASADEVASRLAAPGVVVFEGAQGLLLDEDFGFHPHTTWSRITPIAVEAVLADLGLPTAVRHLGVIRAYLTRHGEGPFPTESAELTSLPEPHNPETDWQGPFRRGHPDAVLLRYALAAAGGKFSGLLVSHLDIFEKGHRTRWCEAYETSQGRVDHLPLATSPDLGHQEKLTRELAAAHPLYAEGTIGSAEELIARFEETSGLPVVLGSRGPLPGQIREGHTSL